MWLNHADPSQISRSPFIRERIEGVRQFRENSKAAATRKFAETPTLFCQIAQPENGSYIAVPETSSEKRRYIPIGFLSCDIIASNLLFLIPDATLYHFGILESNVHMAWMRCVAGRLEMRYRYSKDIVYNCFVWPETTQEQEKRIENTAKSILDVRARYSKSTLSDLYHPNFMPKDLLLAHRENDRAVMQAYGFSVRDMSEEATVAALMELYQEKVATFESK